MKSRTASGGGGGPWQFNANKNKPGKLMQISPALFSKSAAIDKEYS
jgi:hypothetical protein